MYKIVCKIHICGRNTAYLNQRPSRLWAFSLVGGRAVPDSPPLRVRTQYPTEGGAQHPPRLLLRTGRKLKLFTLRFVFTGCGHTAFRTGWFSHPSIRYCSLSMRRALRKHRWTCRPGTCPQAGYGHSSPTGRRLFFLGTWQSTDHQQSSLQVATFWLAFRPLRSACPPCESVLQLTVSFLASSAALYVLWL